MNNNAIQGSSTNIIPPDGKAFSGENSFGKQTNIIPSADSSTLASAAPSTAPVRPYRNQRTATEQKLDMRYVAIGLAALFIGFIACVHFFLTINKPTKGEYKSQTSGELYIALRTSDTNEGKMKLQLSVTNNGPVTNTLKFKPGPMCDFVVQKNVNLFFFSIPLEVWRYSKHFQNNNVKEEYALSIPPNEEKVFSAEWDYKDNDNYPVDSSSNDRFTITGELKSQGNVQSLQIN